VLGFVGGTGKKNDESLVGLEGLEKTYERLLAGKDGWMRYERDSAGRAIPLADQDRVDPVPGRGLRLTIDRDIQWFTEQALAAKVSESRAQSGQAVVMDATTGAVLALADAPVVDPGDPGASPKADRGSRAAQEPYEPGSVQKVLTMAALLDAGVITPDDVIEAPDSIQRGNRVIGDFAGHEDWLLTPAGVLAKSSNVGTLLAAERLDKKTLRDYLLDFGYGEPVGLGLPLESASLLPELDEWSDLTHDTVSFGQGLATTVVHLASAYATIANGGVREQPHLVSSVIDPDGTERPVSLPEPTRVVSEQTAAEVTTMMEAVMGPEGTAQSVVVEGYRLAGKTGTAERVDPECSCYRGYTATFAGFAPADDPRLVVVVSIQDPKVGRYGGQLAGPVFADVLSFALPRLGIAPSGRPAAETPVFAG
jgi:cell division protein FtsI (penicillin-binding protein 3)